MGKSYMNASKIIGLGLLLLVHPFVEAEENWEEPILLHAPLPTIIETIRIPGRITSVTVHPKTGFSYRLVQAGGNGEFEPPEVIPALYSIPQKVPLWTLWEW